MSDGTREDLFVIFMTIDGVDCGKWDRISGGDVDSDETKYRAAGEEQESLGGSRVQANPTVTRNFRLGRDSAILPFLNSKVGVGDVVVTKQALDRNKKAFGAPLVYTGILKSLSYPDANSTANDAALVACEISASSAA